MGGGSEPRRAGSNASQYCQIMETGGNAIMTTRIDIPTRRRMVRVQSGVGSGEAVKHSFTFPIFGSEGYALPFRICLIFLQCTTLGVWGSGSGS